MPRRGRLGARMPLAHRQVARVVPQQPAVRPLLAVLRQRVEPRLLVAPPQGAPRVPVARPQLVDPRVLAVLLLAVRRHDPRRADGRPPLDVRLDRLGPTRMRQRLSPAATR
jgi:hypothetical protein